MKNADSPAMAILPDEPQHLVIGSALTKREQFAMVAMQGILASGATYKGSSTNRDLLAADAAAHADALLAELERTK